MFVLKRDVKHQLVSDVQDVMSSDRRRHALTLRVRDYYASERLYLLRCLKHLLSFYSEQHHPYSVSVATLGIAVVTSN